jgi:hypothetical protein
LLTIASSIWFCEYENRSSDRSSDYVSEKFWKCKIKKKIFIL